MWNWVKQLALPLAVIAALAAPAMAAWPERPVKVVIPYPPGGPNDTVGRPWAEKLGQALGQPFVVDNRGGASGMVGCEVVARAAPDGYTLLLASTSTMTTTTQGIKINFDPVTSFTQIARVGDVVPGWAVHPKVPAHSMAELIAYAKANPGKLTYGGPGIGLTVEALKRFAGIDILYVPYRGSAEAMTDVLAGVVDMTSDIIVMPHAKAQRVRLLAFAANVGHPDFPSIPSFPQVGLGGAVVPNWYGIYAPAGVPQEVVTTLNAAVKRLSSDPDMIRRMLDINAVLITQTPAEVRQSILDDLKTNGDLLKATNIKVQ